MNTNTTSTREPLRTGEGKMSGQDHDRADDAGAQKGSAQDAKGKIGEATQQVRKAMEQGGSEARRQAAGLFGSQITAGADMVSGVAKAAQQAAKELDAVNPDLARMVRNAAGAADQFSSQIRDGSIEDLVQITSDFARKQPALFVGGAFACGFLLARFAKSSATEASAERSSSSTHTS